MGGLNPFARRFSEVLFARFPQWRAFATVDPPSADTPGALVVEVPAPRGDARTLHISTCDDSITIGFDQWHCHAGGFAGTVEEDDFAEAIQLLEGLVTETVIVAVTSRGGAMLSSQAVYEGTAPPRPPRGARVTLMSWTGRLDTA